ncbi:MAG: hypothetical protein R3F38_08925 [Gammaproteobacteria bacterium]
MEKYEAVVPAMMTSRVRPAKFTSVMPTISGAAATAPGSRRRFRILQGNVTRRLAHDRRHATTGSFCLAS